ncbi:hypothetical protein NHF40_03080 [Maricaulaceae bacterium EIL42A08]|nr:hypothetical protein [Maricaulaceae bacterium EIL42A08]MCP2677965.1 hypothetical protein [Maricaulaceae bacterium NA33B04]
MLWLVWHMWILIGLAFAGGVIAGWVIRSRSDETPERPMLEKLDATVVTPVEEGKSDSDSKLEVGTSSGPDAKPETKAAPAEPAPVPETPKSSAKKPAAKKSPKPAAAKTPKQKPADKPAAPASSSAVDDLTQIKGLGPKAAEKLNGEGVTRLSQIAVWSDGDVERFDALINGRGRIVRDEWVKQAKALSEG